MFSTYHILSVTISWFVASNLQRRVENKLFSCDPLSLPAGACQAAALNGPSPAVLAGLSTTSSSLPLGSSAALLPPSTALLAAF